MAAETAGAVLESVWHRSRALADLRGLPGIIVEVFCRCDSQITAQRHAQRAASRAAGHFDAERTIDELWNDEVARPVAGGWPVIEVDTSSPVEMAPLITRIRAAAGAAPGEEADHKPVLIPRGGRQTAAGGAMAPHQTARRNPRH